MDLGLKNKVALVAAASRGLGRAVAEELAAEGASVTVPNGVTGCKINGIPGQTSSMMRAHSAISSSVLVTPTTALANVSILASRHNARNRR